MTSAAMIARSFNSAWYVSVNARSCNRARRQPSRAGTEAERTHLRAYAGHRARDEDPVARVPRRPEQRVHGRVHAEERELARVGRPHLELLHAPRRLGRGAAARGGRPDAEEEAPRGGGRAPRLRAQAARERRGVCGRGDEAGVGGGDGVGLGVHVVELSVREEEEGVEGGERDEERGDGHGLVAGDAFRIHKSESRRASE